MCSRRFRNGSAWHTVVSAICAYTLPEYNESDNLFPFPLCKRLGLGGFVTRDQKLAISLFVVHDAPLDTLLGPSGLYSSGNR